MFYDLCLGTTNRLPGPSLILLELDCLLICTFFILITAHFRCTSSSRSCKVHGGMSSSHTSLFLLLLLSIIC